MALTSLRISITLRCCNTPHNDTFSPALHSKSTLFSHFSTRQSPSRASTLTCSGRRRGKNGETGPVTPKNTKKKNLPGKKKPAADEDEDAFEALFRQLEEDLKNDELNGIGGDDDEEISAEEMANLELELAEALMGDTELMAAFESIAAGGKDDGDEGEEEEEGDVIDVTAKVDEDDEEDDDDVDEDDEEEGNDVDEDDEEEEMPVKLKNWQMRRLAYALKNGRRKTKIKDLAGELCLERAHVLKLLRDPPPSLVLMSAALPDKPVSAVPEPVAEEEPVEIVETVEQAATPEAEKKVPVHVMQGNWSARKRIKKVQVETLEQVYSRSKRPTNAMISSIVHVTNLPRKKVVKWFEDKRTEDGVPDNRVPYNRVPYMKPAPAAETVFTS